MFSANTNLQTDHMGLSTTTGTYSPSLVRITAIARVTSGLFVICRAPRISRLLSSWQLQVPVADKEQAVQSRDRLGT